VTEIITISEDHSVSFSQGDTLTLTIDNQNAVDRVEFILPESVGEGDDVYHLDWYFMHDPRLWMPYATTNPDLDDLNDPTHGFTKLDVATPSSSYANGYIAEEDADSDYPWVRVPVNTTGGSSSTYTCDYAYLVSSYVVRSVRRGGLLNYGSHVGPRCVFAYLAPSLGSWSHGGALYFQ